MKTIYEIVKTESILLFGDLKKLIAFSIWMLKRINFIKTIAIIAVVLIESILLYGIYVSNNSVPIFNSLVGAVVFLIIGSLLITLLKEVKP